MRVKEIMTTEVVRVDRHARLHDIAALMDQHSISCVVVCQSDIPVGIITERDVIYGIGAEQRGERAGSEAHVEVDRCPQHGFWLDRGELGAILGRLELDRGTDEGLVLEFLGETFGGDASAAPPGGSQP